MDDQWGDAGGKAAGPGTVYGPPPGAGGLPPRTAPTEAQKRIALFALVTAATAIVLGILGDALLREAPWGLNIVLWTAALLAAAGALTRRRPVERDAAWFSAVALAFAVCLAWRDSRYLHAINTGGLLVALAWAAGFSGPGGARRAGALAYAGRAALAALGTLVGVLAAMAGSVRWDAIPHGGAARRTGAFARGIVIAVPLLLIFGSLLTAADASFETAIHRLFTWDVDSLVSHALGVGLAAWLAFGYLMQYAETDRPDAKVNEDALPPPAAIEVATVLGLLDVLIVGFVVTQIPRFTQTLNVTDTVAFRAFARRGYFELLAVAALSLPVLMVTYRYAAGSAGGRRVHRALGSVLVVSLYVVVASAALRLSVMMGATGVTELRVHSMAFLAWLAFALGWAFVTAWTGRPERFASGALTAGLVAIFALNAANPDAAMVASNARGPAVTRRFDAPYMARLSDDAVPALIWALPYLPQVKRDQVEEQLRIRAAAPASDWRTLNWGRARARASLRRWADPEYR